MTRSLLRVLDIAILDNFCLAVSFSDGTSGIADLSMHLTDVLEPLKDRTLFAEARVHGSGVVWTDNIDVDAQFLFALAHHLPPPSSSEEVDHNHLEVSLREVRTLAGMTQAEVADATGMAQSEVSRIEARDDSLTSTLRRYVEGLGGRLDLVAAVNGRTVVIRGADKLASRAPRREHHVQIDLPVRMLDDTTRRSLQNAFHTVLAQLSTSKSPYAVVRVFEHLKDTLQFTVQGSEADVLRRRIAEVAREVGAPIGEVKVWSVIGTTIQAPG